MPTQAPHVEGLFFCLIFVLMDERNIEQAFEVFVVPRDVFGQFSCTCLAPGQYVNTYFKICLN